MGGWCALFGVGLAIGGGFGLGRNGFVGLGGLVWNWSVEGGFLGLGSVYVRCFLYALGPWWDGVMGNAMELATREVTYGTWGV